MNRRTLTLLSALLIFVAPLSAKEGAVDQNVALAEGSRLWLVGDSTLHAYTSQAAEVHLQMTVEPGAGVYQQIRAGKMKSLSVRVPVTKLNSGKEKLDKNMHKSLKADENPDIVFEMSTYEVRPSTSPDSFTLVAKGDLTVAGQAKPIELVADIANGDLTRVIGNQEVLMTSHGIKPPSFMGAIKTRDRVVINFDLLLK